VRSHARAGPEGHVSSDALHRFGHRAIAGLAKDAAVDSAVAHAAAAPLPAHCEVIGHIARRTGSDGQSYEIRYHLRLPFDWNRRFFFQGGGGSDGVLGDALGNLQGEQSEVALSRGFAVVSQDSGHDNNRNDRPDHGGPTSFGWDYTARRNYAFASLGRVTATAKALLATFYGGPPQYSYFVGCSKGGQEGMAMAEHFPDDFDGIMANAPGFSCPARRWRKCGTPERSCALLRTIGVLTPMVCHCSTPPSPTPIWG
jgi:feruloyl esterase